jgi:hypothetical protein
VNEQNVEGMDGLMTTVKEEGRMKNEWVKINE